MKHEARETIIIGVALIVYGIAALAWEMRGSFRVSVPLSRTRLEFARSQRERMHAEEFETSEPDGV